jgi:hypothetical protein
MERLVPKTMPGGPLSWTITVFRDDLGARTRPLYEKTYSVPLGLGLILIGLLVQIVGVRRVGFIIESLGNRLAEEPYVLP